MKHIVALLTVLLLLLLNGIHAADAPVKDRTNPGDDGLAPEVTHLSARDVSWALEANLPDLEKPYISTAPTALQDGITVGTLENKELILKFADEVAAGKHGDIDSVLLMHRGRLVFESYYRRGRVNYPHYQMSITKSYTAMAIGRAIQQGHLTMADLDRPVVSFLKNLDLTRLASGAASITLDEAMTMRSGVRLDEAQAKALMKQPAVLKGQGQIQAYLEQSAPIPKAPREFKYQGADTAMVMQVLDAVVPGGAKAFIVNELFGKMRITNFAWENDVSGLPKSAAGSSLLSRDMVKWGMLVLNGGQWDGEQLIPKGFVDRSTDRLYDTSKQTSYGYFWWRESMKIGSKSYECKQGRGAGGQLILVFPELDLIAVVTAHHKGMGTTLATTPTTILPTFVQARN